MRTVDIGLLILCVGAIYLSYQQEGDLAYLPAFHIDIDTLTFANGVAPDISERMPRPIVADLDGDGHTEVILVTRDPKIQIVQYQSHKQQTLDTWEPPIVVREASLLSSVKLKKGRQAIALTTGYLQSYDKQTTRHQYIAVVTDGWNILLFNHNLELIWERAVEVDLRHHFLNEVSILITSHSMQTGDTGAVIVGGRLHNRDDEKSVAPTFSRARHRRRKKQESEDEDDHLGEGDRSKHLGEPQHFSFYSFEGLTGKLRWKHEANDFHEEAHPHDILHPQHEAHSGEVDWRNFRYSIMHTLPHQWIMREDTVFALAHFEKRRSGKDRQKDLEKKLKKDALPHTHQDLPFGGLHPHSADEHIRMPNTLVAHVKDGIEVIHLFSGRPVCRITLKAGAVHADLNADGVIDHVEAVASHHSPYISRTHSAKIPRCLALITSAIPPSYQLYNGTVCPAPGNRLLTGTLKVTAQGVEHSDEHESVEVASPTVIATTTNTASRTEHTVNKHIGSKSHARTLIDHDSHAPTYITAFLANMGVVTAYRPDGHLAWQAQTKSSWSTDDDENDIQQQLSESNDDAHHSSLQKMSLFASISPYRLWHGGKKDHLIVIGEDYLTVLSSAGHIRAELKLDEVPVSSAVSADINNDGWNDIIITTTGGYYAYVLERKISSKLFTLLVGGLLFTLLLVFVLNLSRESSSSSSSSSIPSSAQPFRAKSAKAQL